MDPIQIGQKWWIGKRNGRLFHRIRMIRQLNEFIQIDRLIFARLTAKHIRLACVVDVEDVVGGFDIVCIAFPCNTFQFVVHQGDAIVLTQYLSTAEYPTESHPKYRHRFVDQLSFVQQFNQFRFDHARTWGTQQWQHEFGDTFAETRFDDIEHFVTNRFQRCVG